MSVAQTIAKIVVAHMILAYISAVQKSAAQLNLAHMIWLK